MQIIGAGFGRTGTLSMKAALEQLGFGPCYHMVEVFDKPEHVALWQAAAEGASIDWSKIFASYNATVDWPGCTFYAPLMEAYPQARVILNVRDPERWYKSVSNTIYQAGKAIRGDAEPTPHMQAFGRMIETLIWGGTFGGRFEAKAHAIEVFERHIAEVKERVPRERLLVFDVKEGWEPLCRFLGVETPETPFPRLNDTASFLTETAERARQGLERGSAAQATPAG